jgi:hypothetical protein
MGESYLQIETLVHIQKKKNIDIIYCHLDAIGFTMYSKNSYVN